MGSVRVNELIKGVADLLCALQPLHYLHVSQGFSYFSKAILIVAAMQYTAALSHLNVKEAAALTLCYINILTFV